MTHHESFSHLRPYVDSHLIPTVEFLKSKRLPSGNYLSSSNSKSDALVQWCHGAPGFVYLFVRAYEVNLERVRNGMQKTGLFFSFRR